MKREKRKEKNPKKYILLLLLALTGCFYCLLLLIALTGCSYWLLLLVAFTGCYYCYYCLLSLVALTACSYCLFLLVALACSYCYYCCYLYCCHCHFTDYKAFFLSKQMDSGEILQQKQKYIDLATSMLYNTCDEHSLLLGIRTNIYEATVWFFRTTKNQIHIIALNILIRYINRNNYYGYGKFQRHFYDMKTNSHFSYGITKSSSTLQLSTFPQCWPCFKMYEMYILNKTRHRLHCTSHEDDIFSKQYLCCMYCGAPLEIEFLPNLNRITMEVWSLWQERSSLIEWIPEEVLKDILEWIEEK
jgi:hypothetical protein